MNRPRADASMSLLHEIITKPLEPGYAAAAARPPVSGARRVGRSATNLTLAVALGIGMATAVSSLRAPQSDAPSPREPLEREITQRSTQADELATTVETISAEIAQIQEEALAAVNPGLFARLQEAELLSGALPVEGPGLVIVLDDAQGADPDDEAFRVQDVDLQIVTNGLWAAGAEAIAVNGQRLTAVSAIRGAGQAILVGLAPVLPPYRIEAIGDVQEVRTAFARSSAANHLAFLSGTYGIGVTTTAETSLTLPGAGGTTLNYASKPTRP